MKFIVEQKTQKGWEVCHETEISETGTVALHTIEWRGAIDCLQDIIEGGHQARLSVAPSITPA